MLVLLAQYPRQPLIQICGGFSLKACPGVKWCIPWHVFECRQRDETESA